MILGTQPRHLSSKSCLILKGETSSNWLGDPTHLSACWDSTLNSFCPKYFSQLWTQLTCYGMQSQIIISVIPPTSSSERCGDLPKITQVHGKVRASICGSTAQARASLLIGLAIWPFLLLYFIFFASTPVLLNNVTWKWNACMTAHKQKNSAQSQYYTVLSVKINGMCMGENEERSLCLDLTICLLLLPAPPPATFIQH